MANVLIEENTLKNIGDAIRAKTGKTDLILPSEMPTEIAGITGSGREVLVQVLKEKTYIGFQNNKLELESDIDFEFEINLIAGEKYVVVWDGVEYRLTATEGLANCIDLAFSEFTEGDFPFYITYLYDYDEEGHDVLEIYTKGDEVSHTFGIHKVTDGVSYKAVIFGKQDVEGFVYDSDYGVYKAIKNPASFLLQEGESYFVNWEGVEYKCVAQLVNMGNYTSICIGNCSAVGGVGYDEPFIITYIEAYGINTFFALTTENEHNVAVYKETKVDVQHELVKYVTFMSWDGATELYKKPTISGDDCVNVVSKGLISKPTRESTNTTNYTYSGWSLTSGGSADSNSLKNVTEDRVVYASFAESVRYYTVNFYKEVSVLHETVQVTYGGTANPFTTPAKEGYGFGGWAPSNENIKADTDCYAVWVENITFANSSWDYISKASADGTASTLFNVGDEKNILLSDGTTVTLVIADFGVDNLADGSGKAGMTLVNKYGHDTIKSAWNISSSGIDYGNGLIHKYLNDTDGLVDRIPSDLRAVLKDVSVEYEDSLISGIKEPAKLTEKIFLLSGNSYGIKFTNTESTDLGQTYQVFSGNVLEKTLKTPSGTKVKCWIRNVKRSSSAAYSYAKYINTSGSVSNSTASYLKTACHLRFGLCI